VCVFGRVRVMVRMLVRMLVKMMAKMGNGEIYRERRSG
jgi:hypothetical protein